jgi:hypothetical protein
MTDALGFKRRQPEDASGATDLSGIPKGAIKLDVAQADRAGRAGEALGFRSREPSSEPPTTQRRRPATPMKSILIKGPVETVDWFVRFTNDGDFRSYWEALENLRSRAAL